MNANSENTYSKADRFAKLSEKLSQLHVILLSVLQNKTNFKKNFLLSLDKYKQFTILLMLKKVRFTKRNNEP